MPEYYIIPYVKDYLKTYNPTSPGLRHKVLPICGSPITIQYDPLTFINKSKGGRNHTGKITVRHKGGGHKTRTRIIDYKGDIGAYTNSVVLVISYAPKRSTRLALCEVKGSKLLFWRLCPHEQKQGDILVGKYIHDRKNFLTGEILPLNYLPEGFKIFNIELNPGQGGQLARSGGMFATVIKHNEDNTTLIKLCSNKNLTLSSDCVATIGRASNPLHNNRINGKAGTARWLGIRPTVRGEAMNPVDHPHGGKTAGGVRLKTVYGKLAKFVKTRK